MADFMDIFGGILGAGASFLSSGQQYRYQRALQEQAAQLNYDYGQKSLQNSPTSTRQGLESAGYNPMLAVQNATSGANSGWTSTGQANGTDYASGISQLVSNAQNAQRIKNETLQTESTNDLNYAQADKAKAEKASIMERLPFISQREKAEIGNIEKDSMKKEAEIHNIEETTRYIEKNYQLQKLLGVMGIDAQIYSANKSYNASTYAANKAYQASKYGADVNAETQRGTIVDKKPFGVGSTRYYAPDDIRRAPWHSFKTDFYDKSNDRYYWRNYY